MKKLDAFMLEDLLEFTLCNQSVDIAVSRYIKDKMQFYQYDTYMCSMCICYRRFKNLKDHIEQVRAAYVPPMRALFASTKGQLLMGDSKLYTSPICPGSVPAEKLDQVQLLLFFKETII